MAPGIAVLASRVLGARKQICAYLELIRGFPKIGDPNIVP